MLDQIDKQILYVLQVDGRISNLDLAARVNLSPADCQERVSKLEAGGYILQYNAQLNPALLGAPLLVFIQIVLDRTCPEVFDAFQRYVLGLPEVLECHMVAGNFDYLIKARLKDMNAYRELLGETLVQIGGVRVAHAYMVAEEVKCTTTLPLS
jgi:Lrp/AsnC family transcriptional regulator, leucine-responsive regulatory protein